jgi:hypothetical protein
MNWESYVDTLEMISTRSLKSKITLLMDVNKKIKIFFFKKKIQ